MLDVWGFGRMQCRLRNGIGARSGVVTETNGDFPTTVDAAVRLLLAILACSSAGNLINR
jgi:hypothetical protein